MPTQIGRIELPPTSFKTTIGIFVTGSIMSPRIFISTSMVPPLVLLLYYRFTGERIRARARHADREILAGEILAAIRVRIDGVREIERTIPRGPPDPLARGLVVAFHHRFFHRSHQPAVAPDLDGALQLLQDGEAAALFFLGNMIVERQRRRVGTPGILEAEQRIVFDFFEQPQRLLEIALGLAGKADDDVGGDGDVAFRALHPLDAAHVLVASVQALHAVEHRRPAGLDRQMDMVAEHGILVDGVDNVLDEIARMRGREADAADAVDAANLAKQADEVPAAGRRVAVAVDVLAEQLDLAVAHPRQAASFLENAVAGPAALRAARERDHAVGARLVAALNDRDVGAVRIVATREGRIERFVRVEAEARDAAIAGLELYQHLGQLVVAGGAGDEADERRALEDLLAFLLRDAAEHAEDLALAVVLLELLEAVKNLLLGLVADAAGVVENEAGFFGRVDLGIALGEERANNFLRIVDVHLAPKRPDIEGLH